MQPDLHLCLSTKHPLQKNPLPPTLQIYLRSLKYGVLLSAPWQIVQCQVVYAFGVWMRSLGARGGGDCMRSWSQII